MEKNNKPTQLIPNSSPPPVKKNHWGMIITVLIILGVVAVGLWVLNSFRPTPAYAPTTENQTASQVSTSTPSGIKSWKTYANSQYGFEVKYPGDWFIKEESQGVTFSSVKEHSEDVGVALYNEGWFKISIDREKNPKSLSASQWYDEWIRSGNYANKPEFKTDLTFSEKKVVRFEWLDMGRYTEYLIPIEKDFLRIDFPASSTQPQFQDTYNQILSTFKFIETVGLHYQDCGYWFSDQMDKTIKQGLEKNQVIRPFLNQGYSLQQACKDRDKLLWFFDFSKGFWDAAGKASGEEMASLSKKALIGISDFNIKNISTYEISLSDYRYEGPGSSGCSPDHYEGNNFFYICYDADDSSSSDEWFVYNTTNRDTIVVRSSVYYDEAAKEATGWKDSDKIFEPDLLKQFNAPAVSNTR